MGLSAKRAKFEFIFSNEHNRPVSGMRAALKAARQGHCAWKSRPPSAHDLRDEGLAVAISQARGEVRGVCGAPKTFMRLRALGVRTSRKRAARIMRERGIRPSMGSISSPWDNAAMESPMDIVKPECAHAQAYAAREEAALDLFGYIEVAYNRARMHSALGYLSPAEFEKANWPKDNSRPKAA